MVIQQKSIVTFKWNKSVIKTHKNSSFYYKKLLINLF